ncbi:MAG TPA: LacI family DNA-binding transcriptional regulator [Terriglobales bacterium]|nr:LacI family DNA-binding transcriptional regulator [Terriglobales bacterium]
MVVQMKDVAERAGVSLSTVSFVLNKKRSSSISPATTKRVWAAAQDLNYHVNVHARRLARGQSNYVGLIISEIANPFFPDVIKGFETAASARGLELLLCNTEYQPERMAAAVNKMLGEGVRGVAIMTSTFGEEHLKALASRRIPVVLLSVGPNSPRARKIEINFSKGILQAIDHLIALGHRKFGVISGPLHIGSAATTRDVILESLGLRDLRAEHVVECNYRVDGGMSAVRSLLDQSALPTALLCGNDLIALGAISALQEANIRVPEDVSVVGVDDIVFARLASPPLTTVRVPREELGRLGFEVLEGMRRSKSVISTQQVETNLVVRKSTAAPKKKSRK